jgi:hypothetical protein
LFWFLAAAATIAAVGSFIPARFPRLTTEIAGADRRNILRPRFIRRATMKLILSNVENVDVDQTLFARRFDFGAFTRHETGGAFENFQMINSPLNMRTTVTAA